MAATRLTVQYGADVNTADSMGNTPLAAAIAYGGAAVLAYLGTIAHRINMHSKTREGNTYLHIAAGRGSAANLEALCRINLDGI